MKADASSSGPTAALPRTRENGDVSSQPAIPLTPHRNNLLRECLVLGLSAVTISVAVIIFNAREAVNGSIPGPWGASIQLNAILTVFAVMALAVSVFALRRWRDLKREIADRKEMAEALRVKKERLKEAQTIGRMGDWEVDLITGEIIWSDLLYPLLERDRSLGPLPFEEFLGLFVPEDANRFRQLSEQARVGGVDCEADLHARLPSGKDLHLLIIGICIKDNQGKVVKLRGITQDITERKKAEAELSRSEHKYRALVEQAADAIIVADLDWQIEFANPVACRMFGYSPAEILQANILDTYAPEERAQGMQRRSQLAEGQTIHFERQVRRKDGSYFPAFISIHRVAGGRFQGIIRDVTAQKTAEQNLRDTNLRLEETILQLQRAQQQVVQQERLSAVGTMAGGIAHDFNNSLTAILGYCELLLRHPGGLNDPERTRRYLTIMNTCASDASNVVLRLREFYRHREKDEVFDVVEVNQLVEEVVSLTQPKWKTQAEARGVTINVYKNLREVPPVAGNPADLREALTNLIFNAVDAMPRGGNITVRTRATPGRVQIQVCDTGTGMTEEVRRRCLEPFFTTKGEGGTGLGLSMVYGIVQRHQGTIDIDSAVGVGTTFFISLPQQVTPAERTNRPATAGAGASLNVLVVDDEDFARDVISEYLIVDGHTVESADNGLDGLEKFHKGRFDVVVLDRAMPGMNGDQVASAIKSANPDMPIVMITGFGAMMEAASERPPGVDLIVNKPLTMDDLRTAITRATSLP